MSFLGGMHNNCFDENGDFGVAETQNNSVKVQLKSGESLILKTSETQDNSISKWKYIEKTKLQLF